ncbi:hypothetical protein D3C87_1903370 [compost metagenome]
MNAVLRHIAGNAGQRFSARNSRVYQRQDPGLLAIHDGGAAFKNAGGRVNALSVREGYRHFSADVLRQITGQAFETGAIVLHDGKVRFFRTGQRDLHYQMLGIG